MKTFSRKLSPQTLRVLSALAEARDNGRYGLEISQSTNLKSGALYPILARLDARGLIEGEWRDPDRPGRPARHIYRLTAEGRRVASEAASNPPGLSDPDLAGVPA